ncbi:MAG: endonuclease/exonuclease/phosphatase family protein [Caldilineaceae bacterium]|nr:endonuclease/exonuclease/phosphatase family protein [Caldilineaceae bacterium]
MRVLTYNIHGWRTMAGLPNLDAVAQVIAATGADLVGLNEVFYPRVVEGAGEAALEALAARLGMDWVFGPCLRWPAQDSLPADAYGNALLSRWPILASAAHHLTPVPGKEQRGLLEARIALPTGSPFTAYVTHLDHTDEEARLVQLRALRTWTVRDRNRPHLIMGDFNAIASRDFATRVAAPAQPAHLSETSNVEAPNARQGHEDDFKVIAQMEKAGYIDAYGRVGAPGSGSFCGPGFPPYRIDYIFLSESLAPALTAAQIWQEPPGEEASDHRPVLAEFDLSRLG